MAGEPITNGVVLVNNGKIEAVGPAAQIKVPANYRIMSAKVVTPGLIDAHSVIGLNGYMNQPHDQMALRRKFADAAGTAGDRRVQRGRKADRMGQAIWSNDHSYGPSAFSA